MRASVALWVAMTIVGCGADDGTRTVHGRRIDRYVTEGGDIDVPPDLRGYRFAALVPDGLGGYQEYPGEGFEDGRFVIEGVPPGPYYLLSQADPARRAIGMSLEESDQVEWIAYEMGRPDRVWPTRGTYLSLSVVGLAPWQPSDLLELFCANVNAFIHAAEPRGVVLEDGATAIEGQSIDLADFYYGPLLEGSKGDVVYLTQLATVPAAAGEYRALARVLVPDPFDMRDGETTEVAGIFAAVPQDRELRLVYPRSRTHDRAAAVSPKAIVQGDHVVAGALNRWRELGVYGGYPDFLDYHPPDGDDDIDDVLAYGDPFPARWDRLVTATTWFGVELQHPEARISFTFAVSTGRRRALDTGDSLEPLVTEVRELTFETPMVAWLPPERGAPTEYIVGVYEVTNENGWTFFDGLAAIATTETAVALPAGLLEPGGIYFVVVEGRIDDPLDSSWATVVSAPFSP